MRNDRQTGTAGKKKLKKTGKPRNLYSQLVIDFLGFVI